MFLSFLEKIGLVFKLLFSSFLEIELGVLALLFFLILVVNLKTKNKIYNYAASFIILSFLGVVIFLNYDTVIYFLDVVLKTIMQFIYFPSVAVYFLMIFLTSVFLIVTIFKNNISNVKKIFNYLCFTFILFMFFSFIAIVIDKKLDLIDVVSLYTNNNVLALVQISNFIFLLWIVVTIFYKLYHYFKVKYDK